MIRLDELPAEIIQQIAFHLALLSDRPQPTHLPALLSTSSRFNTCLNFTRNPVFYARLFRHHYDFNAISRRLPAKTLDAHALAAEYKQRALRIKSISTNTLDHDHLLNLWTVYLLLIENDGKNIHILQGINVLRYLDYLGSQPSLPLYHPHDDYPPNTPAHALALHIRNILLDLPRLHSQHARDTLSYQLRPFVFAAHKFDAFVAPWTYDHLPLGSAARSNHLIEVEAAQHPQEQSPYLADLTPREKIHEIPYCGGILRLAPPNPVLPACQMFFGLIEQDQDDEDDDEELEEDPTYALTTESTQDDRPSHNTRALTANALHQALVKGDINLEQLTDTLQAAAALASVSSSGSQRITSLSLPSDAGAIAAAAVAASVALNNARFQASSSSSSETETSALATVLDELDTQAFDLSGSIDWRRGASSSAFLSPLLQRQQQQRGSTEAPAQEEIFTEQEGEGGEQRNDDVWLALAQALALLREDGDSAHSSVAAAILDRAREVPPPPPQQQKGQSPTPTRIFPTSQSHDLDFHRLSSCLSPFLSPGLPPTHFSSYFTGTWEGRFAFFDFDSYRAMLASGSVRELMGEGQYGEQAQVWKLEEKVVKVRRRRVDLERGRERARWRGGWVGSEEVEVDVDEEDDDVAEEGQGDDDDMEEVEEIAISGVGHSAWGHFVLRGHVRSWDGLVSLVKEYCPDGRGRWRYRGYLVAGGHLVGRWRDTFSPPQYIGYEGCFLLKKREGGGLDSRSVC
ncbi:hypothetical protein CF326_g6184 [Tilletia indica]|nr:hypothetical protein CF326_g6184 [Tilletia indica]